MINLLEINFELSFTLLFLASGSGFVNAHDRLDFSFADRVVIYRVSFPRVFAINFVHGCTE